MVSEAVACQFEAIERRLLLAAYTPSALTYFGTNPNGSNPFTTMVADADGDLFGTTEYGGAANTGTIFEIAKGSSALTTLASFDTSKSGFSDAGLIIDSAGDLFDTAYQDTSALSYDTLYELPAGSNSLTVLNSFTTQGDRDAYFAVTLDNSGDLFGVLANGGDSYDGSIFEIPSGSNVMTTIHSFNGSDGAEPAARLTLNPAGDLFGTTITGGSNNDGTVFEIPQGSTSLTTLASFNAVNGKGAEAQLTLDAAGDLFGMSGQGGSSSDGNVFEIAAGSKTISSLASFTGANGSYPTGGLTIDPAGDLYGTTQTGGATSQGTAFEIARGSTAITSLASFDGANGLYPISGVVVDSAGNLYGTAQQGGTSPTGVSNGNVFEIADGSNAITQVASFETINPGSASSLVFDSSGDLFGTDPQGGTADQGSLFEVPKGSTAPSTIASFSSTYPIPHGLAINGSGNLYGLTNTNPAAPPPDQAVFEVPSGADAPTIVASFSGTGNSQIGGVTVDPAGDVFGTIGTGGGGYGAVFEIASGSTVVTTLASFSGTNGRDPNGGIVLDASGDLFGVTQTGGSNSYGTVWEIANGSRAITALHSFSNSEGFYPIAITLDAHGDIFGVTQAGGASSDGTIFEIPNGSSIVTYIAAFSGTTGVPTSADLSVDPAGNLYGTINKGGAYGAGAVFEIPQGSNTITDLLSFQSSGPYGVTDSPLIFDPAGNIYLGTSITGGLSTGALVELATNTAVTLTPDSPSPSKVSSPLDFTASVVGGVPDGETVELVDASNSDAVVATGVLTGGSATLSIPGGTLSAGTHNLIAVYGGDANFGASESAPYTQTVLGVSSISPLSGPAAGGTTVTITGGGFTGATAVDFGSTPASSFTVNSAGTQIAAVDPAGTLGTTVDVTVVTPAGTTDTSVADHFTYLPSWLAVGSAATWNISTDTLTITGPATMIADPGSDEPNIVASGSAAKLTIAPTTSPTDVHIGGINLTGGASIVMSDADAAQVAKGTDASNHHANHNVLVIGTLGAASDPTISIDSTSKLDLGDNDLIVHTGSSDKGTFDVQGFSETNELKAIEALAATGRNVAPGGIYNGTWTGNGLTSSAAEVADSSANAGHERNILAVEQNSDMFFGGYSKWTVGSASESLGANDIIVKYTYNGDLNLDGAVDGNAATIFSTFYDNGATSGSTYAYGDLNGDGKINGSDATIFATVFGNGLAGSGLAQL